MQITISFTAHPSRSSGFDYAVAGQADVPWYAVFFGLDASVPHSYAPNRETFPGSIRVLSSTGDTYYQQTNLSLTEYLAPGVSFPMGALHTTVPLVPGAYWLSAPPDPEAPGDLVTLAPWELGLVAAVEGAIIIDPSFRLTRGAPVFVSVGPPITHAPEPETVALLALAVAALLGLRGSNPSRPLQ